MTEGERMKRKNYLVLPLALAVLLGAAGCQKQDGAPTAAAEYGSIESLVEDSGTVVHRDPYSIYALVSAKITACHFEEGDAVQEGDILYELDASDLEDQIDQAEVSLKSARQSYDQAASACADLTVRAEASGTVTTLYLHKGDFVSAGTPIAEITDRTAMTLTVPFSPDEAARITPGAAAEIIFLSYSGSVSGTVARVYDTPSALSGGREGVYVEISFKNPGALAGGETASARIGSAACMENGQAQAATSQTLYATQSGQVTSLAIDTGSAVSVGEAIMTIENDSLTGSRDSAAIAVENAEVALDQLIARREDYVLRAPADGIILTRTAREGDFASAATPLATLAEENSLGVEVSVDEIYIDKLFTGQDATVSFTDDSGQSREYSASVRRISQAGVTSGGVTNYTVELTLDDTDGLRSGMNVWVSIVTGARERCLRVPSEAVSGGVVQVQRGGKTEEVSVKTGISGGGYTEILEGLEEGDVVLLPAP